jgi:hypothetical protein
MLADNGESESIQKNYRLAFIRKAFVFICSKK